MFILLPLFPVVNTSMHMHMHAPLFIDNFRLTVPHKQTYIFKGHWKNVTESHIYLMTMMKMAVWRWLFWWWQCWTEIDEGLLLLRSSSINITKYMYIFIHIWLDGPQSKISFHSCGFHPWCLSGLWKGDSK